jgi:hypothetical protein
MREPRDDGPPFRLEEKRPAWKYARCIPLHHTGGAAALVLRLRPNPANTLRRISVGDVLSPSLRAHIGVLGSAAAAKCVSPATMDPLSDLKKNALPGGMIIIVR